MYKLSDDIIKLFDKWTYEDIENIKKKEYPKEIRTQLDNFFNLFLSWNQYNDEVVKAKKWVACKERVLNEYRKQLKYSSEYNQDFYCSYACDDFYILYLGNPENYIIVLDTDCVSEIAEKDYSDYAMDELEGSLGIVPKSAYSLSKRSVEDNLKDTEGHLHSLEEDIENVKGAKTGVLAEIQKQIELMQQELEAKKELLLAELYEKQKEMEAQKEQLENQIYLLDSQIYAIRCYSGEVVNFVKIREGENSSVDEPIVIYQKLRFLDEDLAKLCSLYEIEWENINMFEDFLKYSPYSFEVFAPNPRCVSLVRLSRTGKQLGRDNRMGYQNMLKQYDYYHGSRVGILIRNGENLYLGWTDEDRINIQDDLILGKPVVVTEPCEEDVFRRYESEENRIKREKKEKKAIIDGLISREFVYQILQGVVDNSDMLPLPTGIKLNKQSDYVKYSLAENWLTDNRYPTFKEMKDMCNSRVLKGDMILSMQSLYPNQSYKNDRGRGYANRTYDCRLEDCKIYPVNLVEYTEPVKKVSGKILEKGHEYGFTRYYDYFLEELKKDENFDEKELTNEKYMLEYGYKDIEIYDYTERSVYVSLEKDEYWHSAGSRANFELFDNEYLNLTYMNSKWVEWVINTQKLGDWGIGGERISYNYAIRYLKTALDYLRKREQDEQIVIMEFSKELCKDVDWPVKLSEWKMANKVRTLTSYQAKRFVKSIEM